MEGFVWSINEISRENAVVDVCKSYINDIIQEAPPTLVSESSVRIVPTFCSPVRDSEIDSKNIAIDLDLVQDCRDITIVRSEVSQVLNNEWTEDPIRIRLRV